MLSRPQLTTLLQSLPRRARRRMGARVCQARYTLNSASGVPTAYTIWRPVGKGRWPLVLLTPGTDDDSSVFEGWSQPVNASEVAGMGMVCLSFDPAGRGESWGEEDYGGPEHQDQVRTLLREALALPYVDAQRAVVVSVSLGLTMAAGALAGFELPVRALIDWEGPCDREIITAGGERMVPALGHKMDDESYWRPREATRQLQGMRCGYWRLQAERDHAQPGELRHAERMLAAATSAKSLPWFALNFQPRGAQAPLWLKSGRAAANVALLRAIKQVADEP